METTVKNIIKDVADVFGVKASHITAKNRGVYAVSDARFACYTLLYDTGMTLSEVGRVLNRDHGSVIHGMNRFRQRRTIEKKLALRVKQLQALGYEL